VLVKHLEGKALFTALLHLYATTHKELCDLARHSQSKRRIMRNSASREDRRGIPQMNLSPRKRPALAEVTPYVIHVYGHKLTCLLAITTPP
jgi:hypothetical protein